MSKLKTKSGVKKRFKVTASGRVKVAQSGKRHGMIKRTPKQIRQKRGTDTLEKPDEIIVKKWMPYARRAKSARAKPVGEAGASPTAAKD